MTRPQPPVDPARVRALLIELGDVLGQLAAQIQPPTAPPGPVTLIPPAEAARRLGISRSSMYVLLAKGGEEGVRSVRIGGRRCVPVSEITRLAGMATGDGGRS